MEKVLVAGHETLVSVMTLRPATTYHFRIVAENDIGISEPSDVVTIISAEEGNYIVLQYPFVQCSHYSETYVFVIYP